MNKSISNMMTFKDSCMLKILKLNASIAIILMLFFGVLPCAAQQENSADSLFSAAKQAAFEQKDYRIAIQLTKKALSKSPEQSDVEVFLGRLYTWSDHLDSARTIFQHILQRDPTNEDASLAYGSLEFWNKNSGIALEITEKALRAMPESRTLLFLKAQVLNELNRTAEAGTTVNELLKIDPKNSDARALANRLKDNSSANRLGLSYDFVHFDQQFDKPWHLTSISYGRQTELGSIGLNLNYANRFGGSGLQAEIEAYPRISKTFYAYVSGAYSNDPGIFPEYRAGFSLFANLPAALEAEAGLRFLYFNRRNIIYTLALGKYYKNYWFNFRTYLTPAKNNISQSYAVNTRYYYGGPDDYLSLSAGTGISPDDTQNNVLLAADYQLKSTNISAGYRRAINYRNIVGVGVSWLNQEYMRSKWGNQYNLNLSYQLRF